MVVPRSVFQYTSEYLTLHEPLQLKDVFCYSCEKQFWSGEWVFSNYNGLRLVRRHLLCSYRKNILDYKEARALNPDAPSLADLESTKVLGPVTEYEGMSNAEGIAYVLYRKGESMTTREITNTLNQEWKTIDLHVVSMELTTEGRRLSNYIDRDFVLNYCPTCGLKLSELNPVARKEHLEDHRTGYKLTESGIKWFETDCLKSATKELVV